MDQGRHVKLEVHGRLTSMQPPAGKPCWRCVFVIADGGRRQKAGVGRSPQSIALVPKLCLGTHARETLFRVSGLAPDVLHKRETEFRGVRSQTKVGNEGTRDSEGSRLSPQSLALSWRTL